LEGVLRGKKPSRKDTRRKLSKVGDNLKIKQGVNEGPQGVTYLCITKSEVRPRVEAKGSRKEPSGSGGEEGLQRKSSDTLAWLT